MKTSTATRPRAAIAAVVLAVVALAVLLLAATQQAAGATPAASGPTVTVVAGYLPDCCSTGYP